MTRTSVHRHSASGRAVAAVAAGAAVALTVVAAPSVSFAAQTGWSGPASASAAARQASLLVARPAEVDFRSRRVGTENYKRTRITNTGSATVLLVVTAGLPDDFGFGLMPGQTCPVFSPGEALAAGDSCYAVVRFSPTDGFIGWPAVGSLIATATDPATATVVDEISIPVLGMAVP